MIRTYADLSEADKKKAQQRCLNELLREIVEGAIRFDDEANEEPIQTHIDAALQKAETLQTPWFAAEIMLEDSWLRDRLEKQALASAQEAIYPELDVRVVYLSDD